MIYCLYLGENFWLNEGFTMTIERKIIARLGSDADRHFSAIIGFEALTRSIEQLKQTPELTALVPDLKGIDPDDAFSSGMVT
jgi:leukotriene-A4 hydrolase